MTNPKEVMEFLEDYKEKPKHYDQGLDVADVQEKVAQNVTNASLDPKIGLWAACAVKHLLRCGLKDDYRLDLKKAEDYIHRARMGRFIDAN